MNWKIYLVTAFAILLIPATAYTNQENCRSVHLDEAQTVIAPCEGFFVPRERSEELLINEGLLAGEEAANAELSEENRQLKEKAKKNKKKLGQRKLLLGITIGQATTAILMIVILLL